MLVNLDDDPWPLQPGSHSLAVSFDEAPEPWADPLVPDRILDSLTDSRYPARPPETTAGSEHSLLPELARFAKYLVTGRFRNASNR